jgi:hypothetical protein
MIVAAAGFGEYRTNTEQTSNRNRTNTHQRGAGAALKEAKKAYWIYSLAAKIAASG